MRRIEGIWAAQMASPTPTPSITPTITLTSSITPTPGVSRTTSPTPTPSPTPSRVTSWDRTVIDAGTPFHDSAYYYGTGAIPVDVTNCVVGNNNKIYTAVSSVVTGWTSRNDGHIGGPFNYNSQYARSSQQDGIIVGQNGAIFRTTNNGTSWTQKNVATSENFNSVWVTTQVDFGGGNALAQICAVGDNGTIWGSNDAGQTWTIQFTTGLEGKNLTDIFGGVVSCDDGSIYIYYGGNGPLDPERWIESRAATGISINALQVDFYRANTMYAVGDDGTILVGAINEAGRTLTWSSVTSGTSEDLNGISVVFSSTHSSDIFVVGDTGTILYSPNGVNYTSQVSSTTSNLTSIHIAFNSKYTSNPALVYLITCEDGSILYKSIH